MGRVHIGGPWNRSKRGGGGGGPWTRGPCFVLTCFQGLSFRGLNFEVLVFEVLVFDGGLNFRGL